LQTSILTQLSGPLCDALLETTGEESDTRSHSQAILESLERANLFLISLDAERRWYRYHQLFAEVLHTRLLQVQRGRIPLLHQRASIWYEVQERWSEAIHHALSAADFARAAQLIERVGITLFAQSNIQHSLARWLATLPAPVIRDRPRLCLIYAWILFAHLDLASARQWVEEAEIAWQQGQPQLADALVGSEIAALRAILHAYNANSSPQEAIASGQHALATLTAEQPTFRCIAGLALGMAMLKMGDARGAEEALVEASEMGKGADNVYLFAVAASHQVAMLRARGALVPALATIQESFAWAAQRGALVYPTFGGLYLNLADQYGE
jgi:LuxR family maltose regulon positive regulatory protein